jgi:hypothetical protein
MKKNVIFVGLLGILLTVIIQFSNFGAGKRDFLAYWSAAHLFIYGDNPYDQTAMRALQQSTIPGIISPGDTVINAWNPPWLILIMSPLGALPYPLAFPIWTFFNVLLLGLIIIISWQMCGHARSSSGILIAFVASYIYGGTISYLAIGQITVFVLLGIVLSVWWLDHQADFLAGAVLLLTLIKPQISYFFLVIILIWVIKYRRWKVIEGLAIAVVTTLIIFWIFDPSWVKDYLMLITSLPFSSLYTSTIGSFFASIYHTNIFYFSPIILVFLIKPILRIQERDGWLTSVNLALLISLPLSPYGFSFDQIVIIPSIVQVISWLWNLQISRKCSIIIIGSLIIFYALVIRMLSISMLEYYWFFIFPFIFLVIYIIPWKMSRASKQLSLRS